MATNSQMDRAFSAIFGDDKNKEDKQSKEKKDSTEKANKDSKDPSDKKDASDKGPKQDTTPARPATEQVNLNEVQHFLSNASSDGLAFFNDNPEEYLNSDMTIKKYPDLLEDVPYLPDLAPIIDKYITSKVNGSDSFNMQMNTMMNHGSASNRHDFSLMVPEYIQKSFHRIVKIANSKNAKKFSSLAKFKEDFGEGYITNSTLMFAMLNGKFIPDYDLKVEGFRYSLKHNRQDAEHILKPLILNHTITPRNYKYVGKDTTTFNFPSNFAVVIALATIDNLKNSGMLSMGNLRGSINDESLVSPNSKSFGNSTIYQKLQQMQNLRMLINTKLQHILFDGLKESEV